MSTPVRRLTGDFATVPEILRAAAEACPDHEAFVDGAVRLTFAAWHRSASGLANAFAALGVAKGDVVCLLLPPSADYAICYQAAMRLGAVTTGINLRLGPSEVRGILERTRPIITVVDDQRQAPEGAGRVVRRSELAALCGSDPLAEAPGHSLSSSDPVAIVWTSGTTGQPKGAVFDHDNLRAMSEGAGVLSHPGDRRLSPSPFSHVGYMTRAWDEIVNVMTTVIPPSPWSAGDALDLIGRERVTVVQGVPTQWSLMLAHPAFDAVDRSTLRLAATGAAAVPPELVRQVRTRLGVPFVVRYTSTEASLTTGTGVDDPEDVVAWTVGVPAPHVEVDLVDDKRQPVTAGEVGTVRVRSGAVMRGYWRDPERTAEVLGADGWLLTGDLGRFDDRGNLVLVGRREEMYIRGGYNVYPGEVEAVLSEHPAVERVAVIALDDPVLGHVGMAVVVARAGATPDLDELRTWCWERLADYKAPDRLLLAADLPLTSMLKVDKPALARMVDGGTFAGLGEPDNKGMRR